ncbi:MAG: hypothetical protein M3Z14_06295 [Candidatus Eremiobacteraeota bacterium]|nr:hypothetical protein [Candidatus Eremiobacteraeota bacterium]
MFTTTIARADGPNSRINVEAESRPVRATPDREPKIAPSGRHDPLIINPEKSAHRPFTFDEDGELLGTTARGQYAMPGGTAAGRLPFILQRPLQTKITSLKNNELRVATPMGDQTVKVLPGALARSKISVGAAVTITADSNAIVHMRLTNVAKPYGGVYVGALQSVGDKNVTLRFPDSTVRRFVAGAEVVQRVRTLVHKTIALQSTDGLSARALLTADQLNHLLNSMPRGRTDGSRLVALVTSTNQRSVSVMLEGGDIRTIPCDCQNILAKVGDLATGDAVIADLDRNATITSLMRYPGDGRMTGQVVSTTAGRLTLKTATGEIKSFSGSFAKSATMENGKTVTMILDSNAEVASISAPRQVPSKISAPKTAVERTGASKSTGATATVITGASSAPTRCWLRKNQARPGDKQDPARSGVNEDQAVRASHRQKLTDDAACESRVAREKTVAKSPRAVAAVPLPVAPLGCRGQDSANIFIALRHWRTQAPVDNAAVNIDGPASISLMSPPSGYIELLNVPAGTYRMRVQKIGVRESGTAVFDVRCNDAVRVQANLHTSPRIVRVVRIHKRELTFRVVDRQKAPMNCTYDRRHRSASGYYTCRVKKVPAWKKTR